MSDDLRALVQFVRNQTHPALTTQHKMADAIESLLARAEAAEAECARLRQDAERYRWVRDTPWPDSLVPIIREHRNCYWDDAIDRAIAEGKHET